LPVLDREGQIEPDLPPVGDAIGEFRRAIEAVIGDEAAGKRRILRAKRHIIEVLLDRELSGGGDARVIDLDFVGSRRRPGRHRQEDRTGQQHKVQSKARSETSFHDGFPAG